LTQLQRFRDPEPPMQVLRAKSLDYLVVSPPMPQTERMGAPVLCFLHGLCEAAPLEIRQALTLHGPLRDGRACNTVSSFVVVAPQLPAPESRWGDQVDAVLEIVRAVQQRFRGDPSRTYLTGFSFGADGLFELAQTDPGSWAALWAVDPTRLPSRVPTRPTWLSLGEMSRARRVDFEACLSVASSSGDKFGDFVCEDRGLDHVGTATAAYRDDDIYRWMLQRIS
jgi:predicted peptidase